MNLVKSRIILLAALSFSGGAIAQTLITPSNPYVQNWDSTTLADDGWGIRTSPPNSDGANSESLVSRDDGMALEVNGDFRDTQQGVPIPATVLRLETSSSYRVVGDYELSEIRVEFDLFMDTVNQYNNLTFGVLNRAAGSESLRWDFKNTVANVWQQHSFTLDTNNDRGNPSGALFDPSVDFEMEIIMDNTN